MKMLCLAFDLLKCLETSEYHDTDYVQNMFEPNHKEAPSPNGPSFRQLVLNTG